MNKTCSKCNAQLYPSQKGLQCAGCGYVYGKEKPKNRISGPIFSADIESVAPGPKKAGKVAKQKPQIKSAYWWETRKEYLHRHNVLESEILLDTSNGSPKEYWIEDNFSTGETIKRYVPKRFFRGSK
jgi:hypothetical protein